MQGCLPLVAEPVPFRLFAWGLRVRRVTRDFLHYRFSVLMQGCSPLDAKLVAYWRHGQRGLGDVAM